MNETKERINKDVSPSRSYIIFTEDAVSDQKDIYLVTLPYQYGNDIDEAVRYLYENRLPEPNITNCLTFEMYVKGKPGVRPLIGPTDRIVKITMKNNDSAMGVANDSSPSKTYVFIAMDPMHTGKQRVYRMLIPKSYQNNLLDARRYFAITFPGARVILCMTYEEYEKEFLHIFDNPFEDFHIPILRGEV